ncbi:MAG: 6-carboxytetrahydropterin synthase [Rhodospirillaceae bacterium]|nr:6-carboxytetrahydropterin synthase [Rhodospirillaceae bacterium]
MAGRFEIIKEFGFEAAHAFTHKPAGHENTRLHGHSFRVEVALRGEPDDTTGCVVDFEKVTASIQSVRGKLDHHYLNDIPGLETPSLENLAAWIAGELRLLLPQLASITVRRPTLGESCRFEVV